MFLKFLKDQSGAVTVDWVVMTAAVVGIGIATAAVVSDGMDSLSDDVSTQLTDQEISTSFDVASLVTEWSGNMASDYVAYGQSLAPGNNGAVYAHATSMAASEAPSGYNFDNPLYEAESGNVIYTSDDGQNYSIGGVVTPVSGYSGTANYFGA
jgi:Flp pilus assembly pilin Flp